MKKAIRILATLIFVSGAVSLVCAQDAHSQRVPLPSDIYGPQLIAWSEMQKPQPMPQPLPPPDRPIQPSDPQPAQQATQSSNAHAVPQAQTFTGTIVKDGGRYLLKVSRNSVYQLDDREKAKRYEGKQVKVEGILDADGNTLHVNAIELLS